MSNSSFWPIDRTQSGANSSGQSGRGDKSNERVLRIPPNSRAGASPSDGLMSLELGVLPLLKKAVGVFYSTSQLGYVCAFICLRVCECVCVCVWTYKKYVCLCFKDTCINNARSLLVWVLWHINLGWLFNAKYIFIPMKCSNSKNTV